MILSGPVWFPDELDEELPELFGKLLELLEELAELPDAEDMLPEEDGTLDSLPPQAVTPTAIAAAPAIFKNSRRLICFMVLLRFLPNPENGRFVF